MIKVVPEIANFILVKYQRKTMDAPSWVAKQFGEPAMNFYMDCQEQLFAIALEQINRLYPHAHIHVLTNEYRKDNNGVTYHHRDFPPTHYAKFYIYGLLKEPGMYMDLDILLLRRFDPKHLLCEGPFNMYGVTGPWDLKELASEPVLVNVDAMYNSGVVWIPKPNEDIVQGLLEIRRKYFSDPEPFRKKGKWFMADEYDTSLYIHLHNIKLRFHPEVNAPRQKVFDVADPNLQGQLILKDCQSLHYAGINLKPMFFKDYKKFLAGELCESR